MIRDEIKKYVKYCSILRKEIKNTDSEKVKKVLIKELTDVYSKLEFLRGLNKAIDYQTKGKDVL